SRIGRVDVDAEVDPADPVFETGPVFDVLVADRIAPVDAARLPGPDLLGGGNDLHIFPRTTLLAEGVDHRVILPPSLEGGAGYVVGVDRGDIVLVVGHHRIESVVDFKNGRTAIGGIDPGGAQFGEEVAFAS